MKRFFSLIVIFALWQPTFAQTGLPQPHEPCGPNEEILRYLEFSLDHSTDHKQPYWVAYTLQSEELDFPRAFTGSRFKEDPHLKSQSSLA